MQPPAQIEDRTVDFTGTSEQLLAKIQEDAEAWQDKVVIISGKISSFDEKGFTISSAIYCQMKDASKLNSLSNDQTISLKGRVIGYDDLLEELKLDQCIIQ
jgi:wobble nucleotide-excising tRNase